MSESGLMLHAGGNLLTRDQLRELRAPPPEGRWHPVAHATVLDAVQDTLREAGYEVRAEQLAVARNGDRFFGTLDLATTVVKGVALAVGVRNSVDKSFPLRFCAGNRVFVCDNLAFRSELLVRRKHTLNGARNFSAALASAVMSLNGFKAVEEVRIRAMMEAELLPEAADSLILRSYEKGIISTVLLPRVIREWRQPSFDEFRPRTAWSLLNAFTTVLRDRATTQPAQFAVRTMRLNSLLEVKKAAVAECDGQFATSA